MKMYTAGIALVGAFIVYVVYRNLSSGKTPTTTNTLPIFTSNTTGASNIGIPVQVQVVATIPGFISDILVYQVFAQGMQVGGLQPNGATPRTNFGAFLDSGGTVRLSNGTAVGTLATVAPDQVQSGSAEIPVANGGTPQPEAASYASDPTQYQQPSTDPANTAIGPFDSSATDNNSFDTPPNF